ncbi:helix-turn-helix domain-containing protein [Paenibacillus thailandensis]|uniref:Helix-turn-helix domain-containing protein n=1 Tax=Paenibacillus thailandensis TaxID=393250 RepID=A0ABW5QXQ5_9BACL
MNKEQYLNDVIFERIEAGTGMPEWADGSFPLDRHAIIYIAGGTADLMVDGLEGKAEGDSLHLVVPGTRLALKNRNFAEPEIYWMSFEMFRLTERSDSDRCYKREDGFPLRGRLRLSPSQFKRYFYLLSAVEPVQGRFQRGQYLHDLLRTVLQQAAPLAMNDIEDRLKQTIHYMQSHYREDIRVDTLAQIAELHPSYYSQLFKRTMGKTPVAFLAHLRINKAKEMLLQTDKPIREIAADVGYGDEFYFSRRFKETCGYSPTVFAQKKDLRIVSLSYPITDHLLTLGVHLCAAQYHRYLQVNAQALKLPEHRSELWEISREAFLEARPELILCKDNVHQKAKENINDIAPIISVPWAAKDIYSHLRDIASLVHREQAGKEWIERHERNAERLKRKLYMKLGGATVAVCSVQERGIRMYGARNIGHVFYRSLKMAPPDNIRKKLDLFPEGTGFTWTGIQPDEIREYEADYLFVAAETDDDRRRVSQWIRSNPAWMEHPAVRNRNVYLVDWKKWILYAPSMIDRQLEEAGQLLLGGSAASEFG